jgi:hypothetical protein
MNFEAEILIEKVTFFSVGKMIFVIVFACNAPMIILSASLMGKPLDSVHISRGPVLNRVCILCGI